MLRFYVAPSNTSKLLVQIPCGSDLYFLPVMYSYKFYSEACLVKFETLIGHRAIMKR